MLKGFKSMMTDGLPDLPAKPVWGLSSIHPVPQS